MQGASEMTLGLFNWSTEKPDVEFWMDYQVRENSNRQSLMSSHQS